MKTSVLRLIEVGVLGLVLASAGSDASAAITSIWQNGGDLLWNNPSNWSLGVPNPPDTADFTNVNVGTVDLGAVTQTINTLQVDAAGYSFTNGTLNLNNINFSVLGTATFDNLTAITDQGGAGLTVTNGAANTVNFMGGLTIAGNFTKAGTQGFININGATSIGGTLATADGGTNLNGAVGAGALSVAGTNNITTIGAASAVTLNGPLTVNGIGNTVLNVNASLASLAAGDIQFQQGTANIRAGSALSTNNINLGGANNFTLNIDAGVSLANPIAVLAGAGATTLSGSNAAATTATFGGTVALSKDISLNAANAAAVLDFTNKISGNQNLTINAGGQLGIVALSSASNDFGGLGKSIAVNGGLVRVSANSDFGNSSNSIIFNGGGIQFGAASFDVTSTRSVTFNYGSPFTVDTNGVAATTFANSVGGGTFTKAGPGTLTLSAATAYSGDTNVTGGTLALTGAGVINNSAINVTGGSFTHDNVNALTGGSSLTVNGTGATATLGNSNDYYGNTTLTAGTLTVANASGSATGLSTVMLNGGVLASAADGGGNPFGVASKGFIGYLVLAGSGTHTIAPGGDGGYGHFSTAYLTTSNNTTLKFDLTAPQTAADDELIVSTTDGLILGAGTKIAFGAAPTASGYYRLIKYAGAATLANFSLPANPAGRTYSLTTTKDANWVDLMVTNSLTWTSGDTTGVWSSTTGTDWSSTGAYPLAPGDTAQYSGTGVPGVTSLDLANVTVGALKTTSTGAWTINASSPGNTITMDSGVVGVPATISTAAALGTLTINPNVALASDLTVTTVDNLAAAITFNGSIISTGGGTGAFNVTLTSQATTDTEITTQLIDTAGTVTAKGTKNGAIVSIGSLGSHVTALKATSTNGGGTGARVVINGGTLFTGAIILGDGSTNNTMAIEGTAAALGAASSTNGITFANGIGAAVARLKTYDSFNTAKSLTMTSAGTIDTNGFDSTFSGTISGAGTLGKAGAGMLTLSGPNGSYGGGVTVTAGTLSIGSTANLGTGTLTLGGGTFQQTSGGALVFSNLVSISASSTITGTAGNDVSFGKLTNIQGGNPTFTVNTVTATFSAMDLSNSATNRTPVFNGSGKVVITGTVADGGGSLASSLSYTGTGTLTLGGVNTYSGTTLLNNAAGTMLITGSNASPTGGGPTTISNGTLQLGGTSNGGLAGGLLTLGGGTVQAYGAAQTLSNAVSLTATTITSGSQGLTFNGPFTVTGGNKQLTNSITSPAILTLGSNVYLSDAAGTGRTLTIAGSGTTTISGPIANYNGTGTAGNLTYSGTGTLNLNVANSYSGTTLMSSGSLVLGNDSALGSSALVINNAATVSAGGAGTLRSIANATSLSGNNAVATIGGSMALTFTGKFTNVATGTGKLTVNNSALTTFAGGIDLKDTASGLASRTFTLQGTGNVLVNSTIADNVGTPGLLIYAGISPATLTLAGNNTYGGNTTITTGTVKVTGNTGLGFGGYTAAAVGNTAVGANTLDLNGNITVNEPITVNGGSLINSNAATTAKIDNGVAGATVAAGSSAVAGNSTVTIAGSGGAAATASLGLTVASLGTISGGTLYAANDIVNVLGGGGSGAQIKVLTIGGGGSIATWSISNAGLGYSTAPTGLAIMHSGTAATLTGASATQFTIGTFDMTSPGSGYTAAPAVTVSSGTGVTATAVLSSVALTGTANSIGGDGNLNIAAVISGGGGGFAKIGGGTLTLTGLNTYSGTTTVNSGTLLVGANAPSGSAGALGNAASAVLLGDTGGTANASLLTNGAFAVGRAVNVQSGSSGAATLGGNAAAISNFSGNVTLNKNVILSQAAGGSVTFSGQISGAGKTATLSGDGAVNVVTAAAAVNDANFIVDTGLGTRTLGGSNATGSAQFTGNLILNKDAILTAASGGSADFNGPISGAGTATLSGNGNVNVVTASAAVNNANFIVGTGLGTRTLGGSNIAGTAQFTGNVTLNQDATLTAASGGTADFSGTWTTNNKNLLVTGAGTSVVSLSSPLSTTGTINVSSGALDIKSTLASGDVANASSLMVDATIGNATVGNLSGLGTATVNGSLSAASIVQNTLTIGAGGTVTIRETTGGSVSTVPEPGTWVLIGTALMGWLAFRRRR